MPVFERVVLDLAPGQWTCILGPSGVGKSTILRLIAETADGVTFDGQLETSDGAPRRGRTALMAQDGGLLPWLDVLGNVTLGARLRGTKPDLARGRALLDGVGLGGFDARKPAALSGGQRQRVALARTLMEDRAIVLLDEPFSALDARTRADVQDLAAERLRGRTVLHVTHDPGEAARLGQAIFLMDSAGINAATPPRAPAPRAVDAPETLACQAALLRRLMATA
ncbi:MAG: ATP-binding cassette domain-containing protein [Pseudomonadota bacterium]